MKMGGVSNRLKHGERVELKTIEGLVEADVDASRWPHVRFLNAKWLKRFGRKANPLRPLLVSGVKTKR